LLDLRGITVYLMIFRFPKPEHKQNITKTVPFGRTTGLPGWEQETKQEYVIQIEGISILCGRTAKSSN
jgi:hypothetical protein